MSSSVPQRLAALETVLRGTRSVAVAVSGGVDSLTLAAVAHRVLGSADCALFHAVSPAVPAEATQRTGALAERRGWTLHVIDAHEFDSTDYLRNPLERCFYCKTSLYGAIRPHTAAQIVSGTNLDDLGDYRPGLIAAREHGVRHPFVEAGIDKRAVRAIAAQEGLGEIADLPAAPCLSSRIETGIAIDPEMLDAVHAAERLVGSELAAGGIVAKAVRCRVRARGVAIEVDGPSLDRVSGERRESLAHAVRSLFANRGFALPVTIEPYRMGSAFLHPVRVVHEPLRSAVG